MRWILPLLLVAGCSVFGADTGFEGRWNISVSGGARAWWLEVQGAATPSPKVRFVSAYAGDLNVADEVAVKDGELVFGFRYKQRRAPGEEPVPVRSVYRARLAGAKLVGTSQVEGSERPPTTWVGVRAPEIADRDDGAWRPGAPVPLFNGKDLAGWEALEKDRKFDWKVEGGVLRGSGGGANLVSTARFWNFKLRVEYRMPSGSNSGIGLRGRYEVQVLDDYGRPPSIHSNGSLYSRIAPAVNATRPPSEWQTFDITLIGRDLTVVLNGKTLMDKAFVEGLTAMGHDPNEGEPGPISLQGDHGPVEFRTIVLTPLTR